jgi:hypothetical protein
MICDENGRVVDKSQLGNVLNKKNDEKKNTIVMTIIISLKK